MTTRPGVALQELVTKLELLLVGRAGVTIESPKRLRDKDTGRVREHDVVLTWVNGHHTIVSAIECRDRKRPVGVPDVEAFFQKCLRTGVDHRSIVSSTGFRSSAKVKAAAQGIACIELREAEQFDWLQLEFINHSQPHLEEIKVRVEFEGPPPSGFSKLFDHHGEITKRRLTQTIVQALPDGLDAKWEELNGREVRCVIEGPSLEAEVEGIRVPVRRIRCSARATIVETQRPVRLFSYGSDTKGYEIARAQVGTGSVAGDIVLVKDEGGTRVLFQPDWPRVNEPDSSLASGSPLESKAK